MKAFLIIAFIFSPGLYSSAQKGIIAWNEKQPLQWYDFTGPIKDTSRFDAESFAEVTYNYQFNSPKDFYFEVFANFNKNISWGRKEFQSDDLLKHEQLHFDIAELFARMLKNAFENFRYSENFENEILEIFKQKKSEYHLMQQLYDDETNHSLNKESQNDWEMFIANQINASKFRLNLVKK